MRKTVIVIIAIGLSLAVIGILPKLANQLSLSFWSYDSAYRGAGTVTSIRRPVRRAPVLESPMQYSVCFTITDWGNLPGEWRQEFESVERQREKTAGPWCEVFDDVPVISQIKPGDKIAVTYLLYNDSKITIEKISVMGVDLVPAL